jgi:hypothetical protein
VNERGNCKEGPVVDMGGEDRDGVRVAWFVYWNNLMSKHESNEDQEKTNDQ